MKTGHLRNDLRTAGKYRLLGPEGAWNQRQQSLPDGIALEIIHLALLNSLSGQADEIVLIEPFINRIQLHLVAGVKPFELSNSVSDTTDSCLERCSPPHLISDVIAVRKVVYEDAQT